MERYIIAIDQSTSASKAFLVNEQGEIVRRAIRSHQQYYPLPGYAEHDAEEIWQNVLQVVTEVIDGVEPSRLAALAVCNQRETTVLWDRATGLPLNRAIVWQDVRGEKLCEELWEHADRVRRVTGLQFSAYYSAAKASSVLRENTQLLRRAHSGEVCVGTVDSYLIYRLTQGRTFATDVSNASRTQLCDISALQWDDELCRVFDIPRVCLPQILASDAFYGETACDRLPEGIPIVGVMGDSHAALFGQGCLDTGMAKATFGTGSSVMLNVGWDRITSDNGLSSSVGFGFGGKTCYVLEGNVTCSGDTLCWLRDNVQMVRDINEVESLAGSVPDTEGVYLVPAFSGLGAPYFDGHARAAIVGMNRGTTRAHIVRAALESIAYQDADVIIAMERDTGAQLSELRVDGGPTKNRLLMQTVSDLVGCPVRCAAQNELSALGAAFMAGLALSVFPSFDSISAVKACGERFLPMITDKERKGRMTRWHESVARCR